MAPTKGFWRFMADVHDMTFPMACLDWHKTPVIDPAVPAVQKDAAQPAEVPSHGEGNTAGEQVPAPVNTNHLMEELSNQNKELLHERTHAIKWQDQASMAIKEAKDEAEIGKQEAKGAKTAGALIATTIQQQLDHSRIQVAALRSSNARAGVEKNTTEVAHRRAISVAERRIEELQSQLTSAISHGQGSIKLFEDLYKLSQDMHDQLVAKDRKIAAKETENKALQERFNARESVIADVSEKARKSREACDKAHREKVKSEKAQRDAERKVGELQREAGRVKATTDRSMNSLQTQLTASEARVTSANAQATKAEGEAEQLRRDLNNTEEARDYFEKREGELAARLDAFPTLAAGSSSQSTRVAASVQESETSLQIPTPAADEVMVPKVTRGPSKKSRAEEWKRNARRELEEQNRTVLATERQNLQQELERENQTTLAADRKSIHTQILGELKIEFEKELTKRQTKWQDQHDREKSELETKVRNETRTQAQEGLASQKTRWETEYAAVQGPRLESDIRTQLRKEYQDDLARQKSEWQTHFVDNERSQLERKIQAKLQDDYEDKFARFKDQWEIDHPISQAGPSSQTRADSGNPIEVDEPENAASTTPITSEEGKVLDSLSLESNETHLLMQEIAAVGLLHGSNACTVLRELNMAKDALYEVKCELRRSGTVVDKNSILRFVIGVQINEHYIGKLGTNNREVLIRQANEANERLEYVRSVLGTNEDVPRDDLLDYLLKPLKTEDEIMGETGPMDVTGYPQMASGFGVTAAAGMDMPECPQIGDGFGTSEFARYSATPSTSPFTTVNGSASSAARGPSTILPSTNGFNNISNSNPSDMPVYPQINEGSGTSKFSHMINNARYSAVPSSPAFTTIIGPPSSAPPGPSPYLPSANPFGNVVTSGRSPTDPKPSSSTGPQTFNGFGPTAPPMVYQAPTKDQAPNKGVYNPFEASHFGKQPSLDSTPSKNNQGGSASDGVPETKTHAKSKFKKTFRPVLPQGEGSAPPVGVISTVGPKPIVNYSDSSSAESASDIDHDMDTDSSKPSLPTTQDQGGIAGLGLKPAPQRKIKTARSPQRKPAPKPQAAPQRKINTARSPARKSVPKPQAGPFGVPRTAFTLDPNHSFGK